MNKLTITLKQHTPLLHFQPMQEGATLRASEVKPKLDKFLLTKLGEENPKDGRESYERGIEVAKEKGWLLMDGKNDCRALNYKMRIAANCEEEVFLNTDANKKGLPETEPFPNVLSNMGGKGSEEQLANLVMHKEVTISILLPNDFNSTYVELFIGNPNVEGNIVPLQVFFALNNFGQRTTKGFGSFTAISLSLNGQSIQLEKINSRLMPKGTSYFVFDLPNEIFEKQKIIFSVIDFYWKCLKSGINYKEIDRRSHTETKRYVKSFLYIYLQGKNQTWEKREIKQKFKLYENEKEIEANPNTPFFARALMGLPDNYEYRFKTKPNQKLSISGVDKNNNESIDRIASPIVFKPIMVNSGLPRVCVFVLFDESLINELKNTSPEFSFKLVDKNDKTRYLYKDTQPVFTIDAKTDIIDYHELIKNYHIYLRHNTETSVDFKNAKGETIKGMNPRLFNWRPILERGHYVELH